MTVRFHDQYMTFREVDGLSDPAFRLAIASVFWVAANNTDGVVPAEDLGLVWRGLRDPERFAAECVRRGAWHDARYECESEHCPAPAGEDGWVIHNYWLDRPRRAEAEACEAGKSKGGKWGNHKRWHADKGIRKQGCEFCFPPPDRIRSVTDRISDRSTESDTESIDRSDFDLDLTDRSNLRSISQSSVTDRISDDGSDIRSLPDRVPDAAGLGAIADALTAKAGRLVIPLEAGWVADFVLKRAANTGKPVGDSTAYVLGAVKKAANAADVEKLIAQATPTRREILDEPQSGQHEFDGVKGGPCRICDRTRNSPKHTREVAP